MSHNPEVRINYAWMLDPVSELIADRRGESMLDSVAVDAVMNDYREIWHRHGSGILDAICRILGLEFYRDVIDVHIGQYFIPQSDPIIIGIQKTPDIFLDTLTHELIHVLLLDNQLVQTAGKDRDLMLGSRWQLLFGDGHSFNTVVHIPVHAVLDRVFTEYFGDVSRRDRDIENVRTFKDPAYSLSWDYVVREGAEKIVEQIRNDYSGLAKKENS